jgi:two-component system OmpR family sensor kinase
MRQFLLDNQILGVAAALGAATLVAVGLLVVRLRRLRRRLTVAVAGCTEARAVSAATDRMLRLAAAEFRAPALTLLGHAERLGQGGAEPMGHGTAIAAIAEQLLSVADALQDHGLSCTEPRTLRKETLCLGAVVADAVAAVEAGLAPGRRDWRISADLDARLVKADRRALHQVLLRVLTNAARLSRQDDAIDIFCAASPTGVTLVVADEGAGLATLDPAWSEAQPDSRGLGLGLSLARALMVAHGGSLSIESAARVGTRVTLHFPAEGAVAEALLAA